MDTFTTIKPPRLSIDVKAGTVIGACKGRHRAVEFRAFLDQVEAAVPADLDVHLVLDNAATHKTKLVRAGTCISPQPRPRGSTSSRAGSRS